MTNPTGTGISDTWFYRKEEGREREREREGSRLAKGTEAVFPGSGGVGASCGVQGRGTKEADR